MPAPLRITLTEEEDRTLSELRLAQTVPQRTRDRAPMLRLNAQGWTVPAIADIFECHEHTVRDTLKRWEQVGLCGLWEAPGRGAKRRWQEADMQHLEQCLEQDQRTYTSEQLSVKLEQDRQVQLSPDRLRRILKKRGGNGSALATHSILSKTRFSMK
ncbi:helix-turn-helix domain-containing protein [Leptolyngbya sp. AN03gr2]|uniref:helix-turn-helix domain-containing protein n=1 Tax=unclassified Leptolyngbya TaxID=2650499 RepID=UPI003D31C6D9